MAFFQGSLQEGIAAALQQARSVVCFVTDGEAESQVWENDFFAEDEIRPLLHSQAVSLRLPAGSQEEGFLAQLYPIPKKPTVVIIKNGELKEYIAAGVSKDDFVRRMKASLAPAEPAAAQAEPAPEPTATTATTATTAAPAAPAAESSASSSGQATPPTPTDSRVQSFLAERAARLAEKKRKDEEEAKRQRAEKAKAKAAAEAGGAKPQDEQSKHAEALRKRQREAREERQRILKAIEDDKAARRARRAEAEAERRASASASASAASASAASANPDSAPFAPASQLLPSTGHLPSGSCSIQVRLFDGSTIRSRFSGGETLRDVRRWVDETAPGRGGFSYAFKVLLTPLPSRTIDAAEEDRTLQALGLAPSSTLILVRAPASSSPSSSRSSVGLGRGEAAQGNVFQRMVAYVLACLAGIFGTIAAFFSSLLSTAGPPPASGSGPAHPDPASSRTSQSQAAADAAARRRGGRVIAGLDRTGERRNDQQFYNGNSTNFEPRPDEGE